MAVLLLLITLRLLTPLALAPPLLAPRTTVPAMIDSAESSSTSNGARGHAQSPSIQLPPRRLVLVLLLACRPL